MDQYNHGMDTCSHGMDSCNHAMDFHPHGMEPWPPGLEMKTRFSVMEKIIALQKYERIPAVIFRPF